MRDCNSSILVDKAVRLTPADATAAVLVAVPLAVWEQCAYICMSVYNQIHPKSTFRQKHVCPHSRNVWLKFTLDEVNIFRPTNPFNDGVIAGFPLFVEMGIKLIT